MLQPDDNDVTFSSNRGDAAAIAKSSTVAEIFEHMRSSAFIPALVIALGVSDMVATTSRAQQSAAPNPKDHRTEIRAALLKSTPPGTKAENVLRFIEKLLLKQGERAPKLESEPAQTDAVVDSSKKGVKSIRYFLGAYLDNPALITLAAPLLLEKEVTVQWAFDKDGRLIDIFVEKRTVTY